MDGARFIRTIRLENILSYGPDTPPFHLEPLNVFIGSNASGKSNFLEALSILAAAPTDIQVPLREGGGVWEWLWKGTPSPESATIEAIVQYHNIPPMPLRYRLSFSGRLPSTFSTQRRGCRRRIRSCTRNQSHPIINSEGASP